MFPDFPLYLIGKALERIFGYQDARISGIHWHNNIVIFDAEQVYLNL